MSLFTKRAEPIVGDDAKVDAVFDLVGDQKDAEAFVRRNVNGQPMFMLAIPVLSVDKLKTYTTKQGKSKLSFTAHVPSLQVDSEGGETYKIAPGQNTIWFGFETLNVPDSPQTSAAA